MWVPLCSTAYMSSGIMREDPDAVTVDIRLFYFFYRCNCRYRNCVMLVYFPCFLCLCFLGGTWFAWCQGYARGTGTQRGPWTTGSPREYSRAPWDISSHKALSFIFSDIHRNLSFLFWPCPIYCCVLVHTFECVCVCVFLFVCVSVCVYMAIFCPHFHLPGLTDYFATSL